MKPKNSPIINGGGEIKGLGKSPYLVNATMYVGKNRIQNPIKPPTIILMCIFFKNVFPSCDIGY